jgi:hypothetical protein
MKGKMQVGYQKTQNLMLISNPLRKLQKDSWKKSYQPTSDQKMEILTSITLCKSLRPFTFINIISYRILANIFECAFISSFLDKRLKKNKKCILQMCLRIPFHIHFREGGSICQKMAKSLYSYG